MSTKNPDAYLLPFQTERVSSVEAAAILALAEFGRIKNSGLINKQVGEKLSFILKNKDLLNPHFQSISVFTANIQGLIKNNYEFGNLLAGFAKSQNLLENNSFKQQATEGLIELKNEGWLSEREQQTLNRKMA
jgi:hypothetical protein